MLHDLYGFSQKTCLSTEKKHLTAKKRHLSITFAANIRCTYLRSSKSIEIYEYDKCKKIDSDSISWSGFAARYIRPRIFCAGQCPE